MPLEYLKPEFFIIGERKCGTSSLYRYICDHPQVVPCKVKEPQFFSRSWLYRRLNFHKYVRLFPQVGSTETVHLEWFVLDLRDKLKKAKVDYTRVVGKREITGEASANMFAAVPPRRLRSYYPESKAILMLRDPVERAFSHYRMFERFAVERRNLPFKPVNFFKDAEKDIARYRKGKSAYFVGPGVYVDQYLEWNSVFGDDLVVIITENLADYHKRVDIMSDLCEFLEIDSYDFSRILRTMHNSASAKEVPNDASALLREFYAPYNRRLSDVLNVELPWA